MIRDRIKDLIGFAVVLMGWGILGASIRQCAAEAAAHTADAGAAVPDAGESDAGRPLALVCQHGTDGKEWCCYDFSCDRVSAQCVYSDCHREDEAP